MTPGRLQNDPAADTWLAFGLDLHLAATADGGRRGAIAPGTEYRAATYRPDWRLPGMKLPGLVGGPVLALGRTNVEPGEPVRAVIAPLAPWSLHIWAELGPGDRIEMHEGHRICGQAKVVWRGVTEQPVPAADIEGFDAWCKSAEPPSNAAR